MLAKLLLAFTVVPLIEIMLFIEIGSRIGTWTTLLIIAVTAVWGAALAHREGWRVWVRLQDRLRSGQMPAEELLDGLLVLVAGALLLTPGFFTDAVGFLLLLPPSRQVIKRWLQRRFSRRLRLQQYREWT
jgi:UPF0716 protein FxsA